MFTYDLPQCTWLILEDGDKYDGDDDNDCQWRCWWWWPMIYVLTLWFKTEDSWLWLTMNDYNNEEEVNGD